MRRPTASTETTKTYAVCDAISEQPTTPKTCDADDRRSRLRRPTTKHFDNDNRDAD
jgi:hypothetical protein